MGVVRITRLIASINPASIHLQGLVLSIGDEGMKQDPWVVVRTNAITDALAKLKDDKITKKQKLVILQLLIRLHGTMKS